MNQIKQLKKPSLLNVSTNTNMSQQNHKFHFKIQSQYLI